MPSERAGEMHLEYEQPWRRLHPVTLLVRGADYARKLVLPAVVVFVLARNSSWEYWLLVGFVPAVLFELFRYFTLRYRLGPDELIVRRGLIFRTERHVPFARIQNINLVQGVLHRAFGVADVSIETAGGKEPEAVLRVLSVDAVTEMRRRVDRHAARAGGRAERAIEAGAEGSVAGGPETGEAAPEAAVPREVIVRLSLRELAILGLITARGIALVFVLVGFGWELDLWDRLDVRGWISERAERGISTAQQAVAIASALLAIPVLAALSIGWCVLRFYDYRLEASGEDLHVSGGLLTRRAATIPRHRIQLVTVRESIMHRLFKRVSIRVETAAGASEQEEEAKEHVMAQRWFLPIVRRSELTHVLGLVLPRMDWRRIEWQPLAPRARRRMTVKNLIGALILGIPATYFLWPWGLAIAAGLILWAIWHARQSARYCGWARTGSAMLYRSGVLTRCASATFADKVQVVSLRQTPFDRRHRMATLRVDTAGAGPAGHQIHVPFLLRATAEALGAALVEDVRRSAPRRVRPDPCRAAGGAQ